MKLPQTFLTSQKDAVLVIVAGRNVAKLYIRTRNTIEELSSIYVPMPRYSTREGYFKTRGHGITIRSGTPYELKKDVVIKKFAKELRQAVKKVLQARTVSSISISVPQHLHHKVMGALPQEAQKKVENKIHRNYYQKHPLDVIRLFEGRT